jgi:hypothetical protein
MDIIALLIEFVKARGYRSRNTVIQEKTFGLASTPVLDIMRELSLTVEGKTHTSW